jgi:hypothetical protein
MGGEDQAALKTAVEELSHRSYALTEKLYATLGAEEDVIDTGADES